MDAELSAVLFMMSCVISVVFMGSQKFPNANDWDKFIKETSLGSSNARTDLDCVSYMLSLSLSLSLSVRSCLCVPFEYI